MPRFENANKGSGDARIAKLRNMLPGSGFENVSEPYGEFIDTGERFANYFKQKGILKEVQYESHGQPVDPRISVYLHGDTIMSVSTYWKGSDPTRQWPELEQYQGTLVTKETLKTIAMVVIEHFEAYASPELQKERERQMQIQVDNAKEMLRKGSILLRTIYENPLYGSHEGLQNLEQRVSDFRFELVYVIQQQSPDVSAYFEKRMMETLKSLDRDFIVQAYLANKDQSKTIKIEPNPEEGDDVYAIKRDRFDLSIGRYLPSEYKTRQYSRAYEQRGYVPHLLRVVKEVSDYSLLFDSRIREAAVMEDARNAVDMRLSQLGALVHMLPAAPLSSELESESTSNDQQLRSLYINDAKEFIDLLVGLGEKYHKHLYDPELAAKYGAEVVMNMSIEDAAEWIKKLDERVGYWKSNGQSVAAKGLFVGIRAGLNERMDELKQYSEEHPDSKARSLYTEVSLETARYFRTQITVAGTGPSFMDPVIAHPMLINVGNDAEFAESMALRVLNFDSLAYRHATQTLSMQDPLADLVDKGWPSLEGRLAEKMGLESLDELGKRVPALTSIIYTVSHQAQSFEDSCARFVLYHQLEAMADGTLASFDPTLVGGEIQQNAEFSKFVEEASVSFNTYLSKNYASLLSGKGKVGSAGLSANQREALLLIKDMRGYGWDDLSDVTLGRIQIGSKIVVMVAAGIAVAVATGGMSIPAQMAAAGIAMTGMEVVMEGRAVGSAGEAVQVYGGKTIVNGLFIGFGRVLTAGRYAAQLRNLKPNSPAAREIFMEAMGKGGLAKLGAQYDDALHFGYRIAGAGTESVVDATVSSWVDTQLNPGTTFLENLYWNSGFLGLPIGMEFRRDVVQGFRMASDVRFRAGVQLEARLRTEIDSFSALCGKNVDAQKVFADADPAAVLKQAGIEDLDQIAQILAKRTELQGLVNKRATMLQDTLGEKTVDAAVSREPEVDKPLARSNVATKPESAPSRTPTQQVSPEVKGAKMQVSKAVAYLSADLELEIGKINTLIDGPQKIAQLMHIAPEQKFAVPTAGPDGKVRLTPEMKAYIDTVEAVNDFAKVIKKEKTEHRLLRFWITLLCEESPKRATALRSIEREFDLMRTDYSGEQVVLGSKGFRFTDKEANKAYGEKGGWKLHLTVKPENYEMVDRWLWNNHKGQYKLGSGGEVGEKDFTIYIGSRVATDGMVRKMTSAIGHLLEKNAAGGEDTLFTSQIAGRFDVQHTRLGAKKEIRYYGFDGVPYDDQAANARSMVNYKFAKNTSDPQYKVEQENVRKQQKLRMQKILEEEYGEYYTGKQTERK